MANEALFALQQVTVRLDIDEDGDALLWLFDHPYSSGETYIPEKCVEIFGVEEVAKLIIGLSKVPAIAEKVNELLEDKPS